MVNLDELEFVGEDLHRPECVLVDKSGNLHVADWRGGVTLISINGYQKTIIANGKFKPKPNGIAILPDGDWLITHLGNEDGGVFKLKQNGDLIPFLLEINGKPLPPTNYVHIDANGRIWITVSTRLIPRILGCKPNWQDGFIVLIDEKGPRIVADNLGFTNECLIHPITGRLYVNETFKRCLSRYEVASNGDLSNKKIVTWFGVGEFPDGFAFDSEGGIWVVCVVSNRVFRINKNGKKEMILDDSDPYHLSTVEDAYQKGQLKREHLDQIVSLKLKNISSIAFGGMDLKTIYLGCLLGKQIAKFNSEISGLPPSHWSSVKLKNLNYM
jgi:sugar lactone lactonase YvrE